jgi:hypothetical protein
MRRASIGLLLAAALLVWAPSAWAYRDAESEGQITGDIVLTWHGDPARGCAGAGLCDVSGSLRYAPDFALTYGELLANGRFQPEELDLESGDPTAIRVRRGASTGPSGLCLDLADNSFDLGLRRGPAGHYRVGLLGGDREVGGFSSSHCAGPLGQELQTLFPIGSLDAGSLGRHSAVLDFTRTMPFVAGPFSGELTSTLRARMPRVDVDEESSSSSGTLPSNSTTDQGREVTLVLEYRLKRGSGSLVTNFGGTGEPFCMPFDACGASGSLTYSASLPPHGGSLTIYAHRRLRKHEHANLRTALRDLRANRLEVDSILDPDEEAQGRVTSSVTRPDGLTCTDAGASTSAEIRVDRGAGGVRFGLNASTDVEADALRTHCQGPGQQDIAGADPLLAARVSARELVRKALHVRLTPKASFATSAYSGTLTGGFDIDLTRLGLRAYVGPAYPSP